jgi:hypothetical protein
MVGRRVSTFHGQHIHSVQGRACDKDPDKAAPARRGGAPRACRRSVWQQHGAVSSAPADGLCDVRSDYRADRNSNAAHVVVEVIEDAIRTVNSGKRSTQPVPLLVLVMRQRPVSSRIKCSLRAASHVPGILLPHGAAHSAPEEGTPHLCVCCNRVIITSQ